MIVYNHNSKTENSQELFYKNFNKLIIFVIISEEILAIITFLLIFSCI